MNDKNAALSDFKNAALSDFDVWLDALSKEVDGELEPAVPEVTETERLPIEQWLAIRKEAGPHIDPETAEVVWEYGDGSDPYRIHPYPEPCWDGVGRIYFARSPGSDIWVSFNDIPDSVREALFEKCRSKGECRGL